MERVHELRVSIDSVPDSVEIQDKVYVQIKDEVDEEVADD